MSDHEFDNYLTLLSSLLRLNTKQRASIAKELRSHMEERLEDLMARGVPREDAIQQALAEFGDAAGLAGQFVTLSRNRKRRWLMRLTTFSIVTTLLIAAGLAIFWPGQSAAPGWADTAAQELKPDEKKPASAAAQPEEPTLEDKLNKRMDIDVVETPLKDVVQFLQDQTGIQFVIKTKKLEEASVSVDELVTRSLKRVKVGTLLDILLDDLELTYVDKDDLLLITTPEDAESTLQIRVYDCRDLLAMPAPPGAEKFITHPARRGGMGGMGGMFVVEDNVAAGASVGGARSGAGASPPQQSGHGGFGAGSASERPYSEHDLKADRLMDIIRHNVDADSWDDVGGPGSISEYNGLIVVTQTAKTHKKVEHVLDMLRQAAGVEAPKTAKVVR